MDKVEQLEKMKEQQLENLKEKAQTIDNKHIVHAIMEFDNLAFDYSIREQKLLELPKEYNIEKLVKRLEGRFDTYVITYILFLELFLQDKHDYTIEELTIVEEVFEHYNLTNLDTEKDKNKAQIYKIIQNEELQNEIRGFIDEQLTNYLEEGDDYEGYISLLYNKVIFEMLYVTTSEVEYLTVFRPRVASYSLRLDEQEHRLNEVIRAYHSTEFVTPTINDLYKHFITKHYKELLKQDPGKVRKIEKEYEMYLKDLE